MELERDLIKSLIEEHFEKYVKGLVPDLSEFNSNHDGAEGDWLTKKTLPLATYMALNTAKNMVFS